jgi:hypothetical protein
VRSWTTALSVIAWTAWAASPVDGLGRTRGADVTSIQVSTASFGPQPSADAAFAAYLRVLEDGIRDADLGLYSPETRKLLRARRITEQQRTNELAAIRAVYPTRVVVEQGALAVIKFPGSTLVPPYFFRHEPGGWTIDLAVANGIIGFDQLNRWYVRNARSEFAFGF